MTTRVPIYVTETDPGADLPPQRTYGFDPEILGILSCRVVGNVVLPEGASMRCRGTERIFEFTDSEGTGSRSFYGLSGLQVIQRAVAGDFGMRWEGES